MIKKNILSLLLLFTTLCTFNSCEDNPYYDDYTLEEALCGYVWTEWYVDKWNQDTYHEVKFNRNGTGSEYFETYTGNIVSGTSNKLFTWDWDTEHRNSVVVEYANGDYFYVDNIRIRRDEMRCEWDGVPITLFAK